jgi:hypothetical protein
MRDLLERYVRSLREQDIQRDAPEHAQDLGTFVHWLLERLGYRILEQTFRYDDSKRIKATGERQWGADILATKGDPDSVVRGYRFVLKRGNIGQAQWKHKDGYLPEDLWLAAERGPDDFARRFSGGVVERWSVVAVHNGDLRVEQVGSQRAERFWQRLGRNDVAKQTARELVRRYLARRNLNLPLPALWLEASVPPADRTLRILVDAHFGSAPHGFEDGGSLILPIALHLGWGASPNDDGERQEADELVADLAPSRPSRARDMAAGRQLDDVGPKIIHLQSWLPPDDAPALWYSQSLARRGLAHTFRLEGSFTDLDREFKRFNRELKLDQSRRD